MMMHSHRWKPAHKIRRASFKLEVFCVTAAKAVNFQSSVFLVFFLSHLTPSYSSIKRPQTKGMKPFSTYNRQFCKEPFLNCTFRHFVISSLSQNTPFVPNMTCKIFFHQQSSGSSVDPSTFCLQFSSDLFT